jgi:LytS/YehU family sensor histidine kinase
LPSIKPEKYYKMQCVATDDWWNSGIYTFYIYKEPYWWQSAKYVRIFWIASFVLLGLLIFGIVFITRYYVNRTNERKNRLLDLELRAVYSQINPHFIFNTLSSALFFINKKNFEEAYTHVSKFAKLLRSYLNSSQERYVTLSHEISMLRNYIELQQIRFEEKFEYDITVDNKIPADNIKIPSLLLQPLVENAINHGLFHLKRKGELHISFMQGKSNNEMICTIDDDGVGRERAAEIKQASTAQHTSYGTKLTRKLIDIFEEYENMNIHLEYIDKKAPQTGTIVKLTIRNLKYDA